MPKKNPNEKEIREVMKRAEKIAGGKTPPQKEVKEKPDSGGTEKEKPQPKPSSEVAELKNLIVQQNQNVMQQVANQNERIGKIENFLKEAQKQAQAQMANQTGQGTSQEQQVQKQTQEGQADQGKEQQEMTPEQELEMLQQAQQQQGQQPGQEGQVPAGAGNPLHIYLLGKTMDMVGKVLPAALMKGTGGGGEGAGASLSQLATEWLTAKIKSDILGEGGGGGGDQNISVEAMKTMSNFQGMLLGSFFNTIKNLPKPMAERIIEGAIETPGGIEEPIK